MSTAPIKPWVEQAALHPDVLAENFSEDIFALDLGPLRSLELGGRLADQTVFGSLDLNRHRSPFRHRPHRRQ